LLKGGDSGVVQEEKAEELGGEVERPGEDGDDAELKSQHERVQWQDSVTVQVL
jgi:hypothetical protein